MRVAMTAQSAAVCTAEADPEAFQAGRERSKQTAGPGRRPVAYLLAADKYSGLLASWLMDTNQPVIRTRNAFSTLRPTQLVVSFR